MKKLKGIFTGFFYAVLMIFSTRMLNFLILQFEKIPVSQDPYYEVLKNGISFVGAWGSLIVFTAYFFEDFIINLIYAYAEVKNVTKKTAKSNTEQVTE